MSTIPEESYQFKNLVLSDKFLDEPSKLATVIGVDDNGEPILFDFAKNPHLFIGGDQGCGKSTLIHSIIMSLMQRNTPDEFQFVYLDAKGLDVSLYKQSKYLHISREYHILDIFSYLSNECNNRTKLLIDNKKKTVLSYNEFAALCDDVVPIPELFVFIDELSYFLKDNKILQHIEELNKYGRTVGIHLVVSDSNPTFGSVLRIARQIPNKIVFRFTYADYKALLERKNVVPLSDDGEILCNFRGAEYVHGHSCFVSEDEVKSEVAKNTTEKEAVKVKISEQNENDSECDMFLSDAAVFAVKNKGLKTSELQKHLNIGYARAVRIVDQLEEKGIVGYSKGAKAREILVNSTEELKEALGTEYVIDEETELSLFAETFQQTKAIPVAEKKTPYEALKNKEAIDARDYPEYARLLKELGIIDVDKVTEPQTVVVSKTEHKAKLLGVSEELAECYGDITLNVNPVNAEKTSKTDGITQFFSRFKNIIVYIIIAFVVIIAIYYFLNMPKETIDNIMLEVIGYGFFPAIIILCVWIAKRKKGVKGKRYNIYAIDNISDGHTFEYVVADLLKNVGFYNVKVTVGSGDFGIDVIGWYGGASYAIQCKKYSNKVGVSAVQEAYSGRSYYGCNYAVVITNNYFTPAAIKLAKSNGVILWDRTMVKKLINGHL